MLIGRYRLEILAECIAETQKKPIARRKTVKAKSNITPCPSLPFLIPSLSATSVAARKKSPVAAKTAKNLFANFDEDIAEPVIGRKRRKLVIESDEDSESQWIRDAIRCH